MKVVAEYIWVDGYNSLRSKTKVMAVDAQTYRDAENINNFPHWNYDGSSTHQATTENSEVVLKPVRIYKNPLRDTHSGTLHFLVLCETIIEGAAKNNRSLAEHIFREDVAKNGTQPMFGLELEFFLYKNRKPLGMPGYPERYPEEQAHYYCGLGASNAIGREIVEKTLERCLISELSITGMNGEVAPGQWEFQVCDIGLKACDDFLMVKYLLGRTAEEYGCDINYEPKPIEGDWNGSGCHVNFSTLEMRKEGGYSIILESIEKMKALHKEHMEIYGADNEKRLTGRHETASYDDFSYGVANRGCSVRIPKTTVENNCGYFEDRRPSSNMDPYAVCSKIYQTCCL